MQIKAYRLAAELRVSEATLLRWLHERGYPEARSHDWLSGQLAQAARRALGAQARAPALASAQGSAQGSAQANASSTSSASGVGAELLSGLQALSAQSPHVTSVASVASHTPPSGARPPEHPLTQPYRASSPHAAPSSLTQRSSLTLALKGTLRVVVIKRRS